MAARRHLRALFNRARANCAGSQKVSGKVPHTACETRTRNTRLTEATSSCYLAAATGLASASDSASGLADSLLGDMAGAAGGLLGLAHSLRERGGDGELWVSVLYHTQTHTISHSHTDTRNLLDGSALSAGDLASLADHTADASSDSLGLLGGTTGLLGDTATAADDVLC